MQRHKSSGMRLLKSLTFSVHLVCVCDYILITNNLLTRHMTANGAAACPFSLLNVMGHLSFHSLNIMFSLQSSCAAEWGQAHLHALRQRCQSSLQLLPPHQPHRCHRLRRRHYSH